MNDLIYFLRKTAKRIKTDESYNWKAIGACNCGALVQEVTGLTAKEISTYGIQKHGEWHSISILYERNSHYEIDTIITRMLDLGMELKDFEYLENLNNPVILKRLCVDYLKRDNQEQASQYMTAWADLLEEKFLDSITIPEMPSLIKIN
jgi:hypothetical protein